MGEQAAAAEAIRWLMLRATAALAGEAASRRAIAAIIQLTH
jgi:hypothetical protein